MLAFVLVFHFCGQWCLCPAGLCAAHSLLQCYYVVILSMWGQMWEPLSAALRIHLFFARGRGCTGAPCCPRMGLYLPRHVRTCSLLRRTLLVPLPPILLPFHVSNWPVPAPALTWSITTVAKYKRSLLTTCSRLSCVTISASAETVTAGKRLINVLSILQH